MGYNLVVWQKRVSSNKLRLLKLILLSQISLTAQDTGEEGLCNCIRNYVFACWDDSNYLLRQNRVYHKKFNYTKLSRTGIKVT